MGFGLLIIEQAGRPDRSVPLTGQSVTIGRDSDCDIVLDYPAVSRQHLRLVFAEGTYQVIDRHSTHGTVVDGQRIDRPTRLGSRSRIWLGDALGNGVALVYMPENEMPAEGSR